MNDVSLFSDLIINLFTHSIQPSSEGVKLIN